MMTIVVETEKEKEKKDLLEQLLHDGLAVLEICGVGVGGGRLGLSWWRRVREETARVVSVERHRRPLAPTCAHAQQSERDAARHDTHKPRKCVWGGQVVH